jgi:hypothetical protein
MISITNKPPKDITKHDRLVFDDRPSNGNLMTTIKNKNDRYNSKYLQTEKNIKRK